ncbi:hypothetical protein MMC06_001492 [Schaereria dolodes]|nr:hypothetical protein [Schaereria dolodes]
MLASLHGSSPTLSTLLSLSSDAASLLRASDSAGNTALHYASAHGHLKCIRILLQAGASPAARNAYSWTPVSYSSTVQAEVYFKSLVGEMERRRIDGERIERERIRSKEAGLRIVTGDDSGEGWREDGTVGVGNGDAREGARFLGMGEVKKAMTPTARRSDGWGFEGLRARASSGD